MNGENKQGGNFNEERKRINRNALISVVVAAVFIITFFMGYFVRGVTDTESARKLNELSELIRNYGFYAENLTSDELADIFVNVVLKEDKYAKYYSPQEYAKILEEDKGRYSGVGIGLYENAEGTAVSVAKVYLNSSAYKKGVLAGDKLVAGKFKGETEYTDFLSYVENYNEGKNPEEKISVLSVVNDFFAGFKVGDEVELKVRRGDGTLEFTLSKDNYTVSYVEYKDNGTYYYFSTEEDEITGEKGFKGREPETDAEKIANSIPALDDDTAYIKLYEFEGDAAAQFASALEFMNTRGRTKLILDLRNNGGGLINVMLDIASYIVNNNGAENISILKVREKSAGDFAADNHYSTSANKFAGWLTDISVIANTGTASASECLIGALSDYGDRDSYKGASFNIDDRLILTEHHQLRGYFCTYGKGIMQTTYKLKSGGALKLTTARIFWPLTWRDVQDCGIWQYNPDNCVGDDSAIARANAVLH